MKVVAVVQARFGASRLPGKVLLDLVGATALQRCTDRVRRIDGIDEVVVATSTEGKDDIVASLARRLDLRVVRGSENDVLARFVSVVDATSADVLMRITADCPLLDPAHSSAVLREFLANDVDYASNVMERRLPRGLDTEVVRATALIEAAAHSTEGADREHVTRFVYRQPERYRCLSVTSSTRDLSSHRWTLDTADDYHLLYRIHESLIGEFSTASVDQIVEIVERAPELLALNAHVRQKET